MRMPPIRRHVRGAVSLSCLALLAACGDASGPSLEFRIQGGSAPLTWIGATAQLSASATTGTLGTLGWSTGDASIATVSGTGLVTARGAGTVQIAAESQGVRATTSITVDPAPATLSTVAGEGQLGVVAAELPEELVVAVVDQGGTPIAGEAVSFDPSGDGTVSPASATTDDQGRARTRWTLATTAGEQALQASSGGVSLALAAVAEPGAPAGVVAASGDGQRGLAGESLAEPVGARVEDAFGNGVPGVPVAFAADEGSGTPAAAQVETDAEGVARVGWTLGRYAGENTLSAVAEGLSPARFVAMADPNGVIAGTARSRPNVWTSPLRPDADEGAPLTGAAMPFTAYAGVEVPDAVGGGPDRELLVRLRPIAHPSLAAGAATVSTALTQASAMNAVAATLPGAGGFRVAGASPAILTLRLRLDDGVDAQAVVRALRADPRIERVESNPLVRAFDGTPAPRPAPSPVAAEVPDPLYPRQAWHYESIGLTDAWRYGYGSADVVVAVVDDGIRFDHPDLTAALLTDGFDFVEDLSVPVCAGGTVTWAGDGDGPDPDPTTELIWRYDDTFTCAERVGGRGGHGTHVAGTVVAQPGNGGGVGIAPGVRVRPVRVLSSSGYGTAYAIAQGILYAAGLPADGGELGMVQPPFPSDVINLSLGGPVATDVIAEAVRAAANAGVLLVAAAGNSGDLRATYPAAFPEVLSVASVGPWWGRASYSTFHSTVELAAPGGRRGDAAGEAEFGVTSTLWDFDANTPVWESWDGTSMASPHVAGVAALLLSREPGLTGEQVRDRLTRHARDLGAAGRDVFFGHGLVDAVAALTSGQGVPGALHLRLRDADSGAEVAARPAESDGSFRFGGLPDGRYLVYGGLDTFDDGVPGMPGRPWSAFGGGATPGVVVVDGAGEQDASFDLGRAFEREPNDDPSSDNAIALGGYVEGALASHTDEDVYRFTVSTAGRFAFTTYGVWGACGLAAVPDTELDLLDEGGTVVTTAADIDPAAELFCAALEVDLEPGTWLLRVRNRPGTATGGIYGLSARRVTP